MKGLYISALNAVVALLDRLSATWAAKLDTIHSNYLTTAVWTTAHANRLIGAAQERAVAANGLISTVIQVLSGHMSELATYNSWSLSHTTTSSTLQTALSVTGSGVLEALVHCGPNAISDTARITVTIDGVVVANDLTINTGSYPVRCLVGHVALNQLTAKGKINFNSSLLIQHRLTTGGSAQSRVLASYYLTS